MECDLPAVFEGGAAPEMIAMAPFMIPEVPTPATALPTMRSLELFEIPQAKEPSSNMMRNVMKDHYLN